MTTCQPQNGAQNKTTAARENRRLDLGRHVLRGAGDGLGSRQHGQHVEHLGKAKVRHLDPLVCSYQQVQRLEVAVNEPCVVHRPAARGLGRAAESESSLRMGRLMTLDRVRTIKYSTRTITLIHKPNQGGIADAQATAAVVGTARKNVQRQQCSTLHGSL